MKPDTFQNEAALLGHFTEPAPELEPILRSLQGPLLILGAGGKMGPTLCVLAKRSLEALGIDTPVIAISRFSNSKERQWLEERGVRTHVADLLNPNVYEKLPEAKDIIYLVGLKFGTQQNPELTWAVNTIVPAQVSRRYPGSRMVALSTGNVYPLSPVENGGSVETDALTPVGEYANAAVARERVFGYCSRELDIRLAILRLNYALDLRYGVLVDLASKILKGQPVDVTMGHFNGIWQRDANIAIMRALALADTPHTVWNLTGPQTLSVRSIAQQMADHLGRSCDLKGKESDMALLSNASKLWSALDPSLAPVSDVIQWTADWVRSGGHTYGKPTHFEVRNGSY